MNLNELLRSHQGEATKASASAGDEERNRPLGKAAFYAEQIKSIRVAGRAARLLPPDSQAQNEGSAGAIIGSSTSTNEHASWDNEGGAIAPPVTKTHDNAPLKLPVRYFIGTEEYSDLTLAVEAHARQSV